MDTPAPLAPSAPDSLASLRAEFVSWRDGRVRGARIPARLWAAAVEAARAHGVSKVANAVHVDYYELQRRVGASAAFVDVPADIVFGPRATATRSPPRGSSLPISCAIEVVDARGRRLRVELGRDATSAIERVARALWDLAR